MKIFKNFGFRQIVILLLTLEAAVFAIMGFF